MKVELTKNEIGFLLQALEQLPLRGKEAAKLLVDISGRLEAALATKEDGKAEKAKEA
jgi:hypothetical protein